MNQVHDRILLTIDDFPSEKAGQLLDYLQANRIGAILFCIGDYLKAVPFRLRLSRWLRATLFYRSDYQGERYEWAVRAAKEGYILGNHSYDHQDFDNLAADKAQEQIAKTDKSIKRVYRTARKKRPANYFRFPYGHLGDKEANQQLLRQYGYWSPLDAAQCDWSWDVDVEDWGVNAANVAQKLELAKKKLTADLRSGNVLVLHDHPVNIELDLFQGICRHVLDLGFTFCTNEDLHEQAVILNRRRISL